MKNPCTHPKIWQWKSSKIAVDVFVHKGHSRIGHSLMRTLPYCVADKSLHAMDNEDIMTSQLTSNTQAKVHSI